MKIFVIGKGDPIVWYLWVSGPGGDEPAGARLERKEPLPIYGFHYKKHGDAVIAASKLQEYVDKWINRSQKLQKERKDAGYQKEQEKDLVFL